jgi:hypothetical protein
MNGVFIQIIDKGDKPIGLWYTEDNDIISTGGLLSDLFKDYRNTDMYKSEGTDGFEYYVFCMGYGIKEIVMNKEYIRY